MPIKGFMKLGVVIPALNEEDSIQAIIERTLDARDYICANSPVTDIEIIVVSDGSTDRTVERARQYETKIRLIIFPVNRGYGAAIKMGWSQTDAQLLGFLDADGTCDPKFFAPLCTQLQQTSADVILGCRLNSESEMPLLRRVGNFVFAGLLSAFSHSRVRDTASGMRVVRRTALTRLFPLPDGLHFTPAMSARAMLSPTLRIEEIDMPYRERVGESKLHVIRDGLRFLRVIFEAAFLYRPSRPLGILSAIFLLAGLLLMLSPISYYVANRHLLEWMIYRFLVADLFGVVATMLLCASYLAGRMTSLALAAEVEDGHDSLVARFFTSYWLWILAAALVAASGFLIGASILERLEKGVTTEHWSRYVVAVFCLSVSAMLMVTRSLDYAFSLVRERVRYWQQRER